MHKFKKLQENEEIGSFRKCNYPGFQVVRILNNEKAYVFALNGALSLLRSDNVHK